MITAKLLKYIFRGMIKGIEDYEKDIESNHMDETGSLAKIIEDKKEKEIPGKMRTALKNPEKKDPSSDLSIEDLLKGIE